MMSFPITDNHFHIDPFNGMGIDAARVFKKAGGTCIFLVNKLSKDVGVTVTRGEDFLKLFDITVYLAKEIVEKTGLRVYPVIGIHPVEFIHLCKEIGIKEALMISMEGIRYAVQKIESGEAVALGEIGRPHFDVPEDLASASETFLEYSMTLAADASCTVQIHSESSSEKLFKELHALALKVSLPTEHVVKHFSGPDTDVAAKYGIMPSVLSSYGNVKNASSKNHRFLMESDFIDDNRRPGAVLGPKTVPRVTRRMVEEEVLSIEAVETIHRDNIEKTYGVKVD